jgi:hypothetical protein
MVAAVAVVVENIKDSGVVLLYGLDAGGLGEYFGGLVGAQFVVFRGEAVVYLFQHRNYLRVHRSVFIEYLLFVVPFAFGGLIDV